MAINPVHRGFAMSASQAKRGRGRARSVEDESPVIVGSIAILAVIVFSCMGMIAPVLWEAFLASPGPRWSEQSCNQAGEAAGAAKCPDDVRSQAFRPQPNSQFDPLIPHL
jgi:hypothetical protein